MLLIIIMPMDRPYKLSSQFVVLIFSLILPCQVNAEKIYCTDGKILDEKITYRNRGVVWYKKSSGSVGIDIKKIERIENDDGSVSKYDYKTIGRKIQAYTKRGKDADAIVLCSTLLETIPDNAQIHYLRGILSQKMGNIEIARQDYDFLVKNGLADAAILNNLGTIYGSDKRYREAVDLFIKAAAANPDMSEAHDNLAMASIMTNDYKRAMSEYEGVIQKEPNNTDALYNLGVIYMSNGEYQKAKELWERALAADPEDADTKNALEVMKSKNK